MKNLKIGIHILAADAPQLVEHIAAAERAGINVAWLTQGGISPDAFTVFGAAAQQTERIAFGTSIVPTYPRHPLAMAQAAMAVDQLAPARFRLGVGPSHQQIVEQIWGIPFNQPLGHLREYLTILRSLLEQGEVAYDGQHYHAEARIPSPTQVQVLASALRPRAFRLCGELTDGAISWMCPVPYLREVAIPAMEEGAASARRPRPSLIAHIPIVVCEDWDLVMESAQRRFSRQQRMPYYRRMLLDAGVADPASEDVTPEMVDALVIWGDETQVAARLTTLPGQGISEIIAAILPLDPDPTPSDQRTLEFLGVLARAQI